MTVFDPSPTSEMRRYYPDRSTPPTKENPMIPNKVKYVAAKAAVYTGSIVAITAVVFVGGSVLEQINGKRWW